LPARQDVHGEPLSKFPVHAAARTVEGNANTVSNQGNIIFFGAVQCYFF
jgi:hypothetical protein